ncbi:hypothetical protein MA16_Dca011871 [Dendrobium catenatum]|uniref:FLZ-type domain-containing protein n=1 Tax=Dendrobium catenatum TaxID=906689 RepID=A0A2I0WED6_9ASPA|nr:hypothetical protein MA16_Dca011871 [Dendrobium catenatum]
MEIYSSISSISSSLISTNSTIDSWIPPLISPTQVEFWYDDDEDEELLPMASINFLEECGVCKRGLGTGRDAYICGGEAVFCSEECRSEWMETKEYFDEDKPRMMKKIDGAIVGERRDLQKKTCYSFGSGRAAEICRASTFVAG